MWNCKAASSRETLTVLSITGARGEATGKEIEGEDAGSAGSSDQRSSGRVGWKGQVKALLFSFVQRAPGGPGKQAAVL